MFCYFSGISPIGLLMRSEAKFVIIQQAPGLGRFRHFESNTFYKMTVETLPEEQPEGRLFRTDLMTINNPMTRQINSGLDDVNM